MSGHDEYHHDEHHHHHHDDHHHHGDDHLISSTNSEAVTAGEGHTDESHDFVQPSAPTIENGYIVVPPTPQSSVDASQGAADIGKHDLLGKQDAIVDELTKVVNEVNAGFKEIQQQVTNTVFAEADSSNEPAAAKPKPAADENTKKKPDSCQAFSLCPYYLLGMYLGFFLIVVVAMLVNFTPLLVVFVLFVALTICSMFVDLLNVLILSPMSFKKIFYTPVSLIY